MCLRGGTFAPKLKITDSYNSTMLLTLTTTHNPATDLGYLLHKNPANLHSFDLSFGKAHVFYPEATEGRCTAALLLDVDPIGLVRGKRGQHEGGTLDQYVNDRPYVLSSFLSVAMGRAFGTAMSGCSKGRQELADQAIPLTATLTVVACRADERAAAKNPVAPIRMRTYITPTIHLNRSARLSSRAMPRAAMNNQNPAQSARNRPKREPIDARNISLRVSSCSPIRRIRLSHSCNHGFSAILLHPKIAKVGNAGFHHVELHFDEVILDAASFCRGKNLLPIQGILPHWHDFPGFG